MFKTEINYNLNSMTGGLGSNYVIAIPKPKSKAKTDTTNPDPNDELVSEKESKAMQTLLDQVAKQVAKQDKDKLDDAQKGQLVKVITDLQKFMRKTFNGQGKKKEALNVIIDLQKILSSIMVKKS